MAERGRQPRPASAVIKRSMLVAGHPTSVSLEEAFWQGLKAAAAARALSVAALVAEIDGGRQAANLSSAIRVFVLDHYRTAPAAPGGPPPTTRDVLPFASSDDGTGSGGDTTASL